MGNADWIEWCRRAVKAGWQPAPGALVYDVEQRKYFTVVKQEDSTVYAVPGGELNAVAFEEVDRQHWIPALGDAATLGTLEAQAIDKYGRRLSLHHTAGWWEVFLRYQGSSTFGGRTWSHKPGPMGDPATEKYYHAVVLAMEFER